jgi:hypothetical protein
VVALLINLGMGRREIADLTARHTSVARNGCAHVRKARATEGRP